MYHSEESEAPKIVRVETEASIRFKAKEGSFDIYDRSTKENKQVKEIVIVPVNDSRFTVKAAQNDEGAFIFSAMYRSAKQNITVLRSENGKVSVVKQGPWAEIKDANLKYTRVMYCLLVDGKSMKRAEFDLQGIGLVQWGKIRPQGNFAVTLAVSQDKSFKTPKGTFYEMVATKMEAPKADQEVAAKLMASDVSASFASFDANHEYRKNKDKDSAEMEEATPSDDGSEKATINLDEPEGEKLRLENVPF